MPVISLPDTVGQSDVFSWWMLCQAILGSFYSAPQIYTIYRNKSVRNVSCSTWILAAVLNVTWTIYGLSLQDVVVTVSSGLACLLATTITVQWFYYNHHKGGGGV
jgi:uncharacterized protein with PQ loop repeat